MSLFPHPFFAGFTEEFKDRIDRFYTPYHQILRRLMRQVGVRIMISIHSFSPFNELAGGRKHTFDIGILYNFDDNLANKVNIVLYLNRVRAPSLLLSVPAYGYRIACLCSYTRTWH
jgi:N-formylglutamate amidohydrolase